MWFYSMKRFSHLNAPILKESHLETPTLVLILVLTLSLVLTPKMVEMLEIKNIVQKMLGEHHELFSNIRHLVAVPATLI